MREFFNKIFNTLVRDVDPALKITLSAGFFILAIFCVLWSFRKKNDAHPIAWGWIVLCIISLALAVVYLTFGY